MLTDHPAVLADLGDRLACEHIGALVQIVTGVAPHPMPAYLMRADGGVETLPQIDILDRLLVGRTPAVTLPVGDPGHDAVTEILTVGVDIDAAGPLERFERGNRRHQLHAVIGCVDLAALQLLLTIAES